MLTKKQFVDRANFIKNYEKRADNFDHALKEFAPSDFTGFYDETIFNHLLKNLQEDMEDEHDTISWWMCDTEWGQKKDMCNIYDSTTNEIIAVVDSLESLYDYLEKSQSEKVSENHEDTIFRIGKKAQTDGLRFALNELAIINANNQTLKNAGWEERKALLELIYNQIVNNYLLATGINPESDRPLELFVEDES